MDKPTPRCPADLLTSVFGHTAFRDPQAAIIQHVVSGGHGLALMPTGGGKSVCYQIPAMVRPGVGVVISPLIALMDDQIAQLARIGVRAGALNSGVELSTQRMIEKQFLNGELDLLYLSPERVLVPSTLSLFVKGQVALFAFDEAHCVSQWGHDFRPEYQKLGTLADRFPEVPRLALTATADETTRDDIIRCLRLQNGKTFIGSFDRPNICYRIQESSGRDKEQLLHFIRTTHLGASGIVYCMTRAQVENVATWLTARGVEALPYHAGLDNQTRATHQRRFLETDGLIMVATIAFGMGINKANVRFVAHLNIPRSIEAYYQETGRAGRDGLPSSAWMTYGLGDVVRLRQLMDSTETAANQTHKITERSKLGSMLSFCEAISCRRTILLNYFGEAHTQPCGNCDVCLQPPTVWDATEEARKALSTVYRTGQCFGVGHNVAVLMGKKTPKVKQLYHDRLSTFGIGRDTDERTWRSIFRQLIANGYLYSDHDSKGGLRLTTASRLLLKNEISIHMRRLSVPDFKQGLKEMAIATIKDAVAEPLRQLKKLRSALARQQSGDVQHSLPDDMLIELIDVWPRSADAVMTQCRHIATSPAAHFAHLLASFMVDLERGVVGLCGATAWVSYFYYCNGLAPADIARKRGLGVNTVQGHLAVAVEHKVIEVGRLLDGVSADDRRQLRDYFVQHPEQEPEWRELNAYCGYRIEFGVLKLAYAAWKVGMLENTVATQGFEALAEA